MFLALPKSSIHTSIDCCSAAGSKPASNTALTLTHHRASVEHEKTVVLRGSNLDTDAASGCRLPGWQYLFGARVGLEKQE